MTTNQRKHYRQVTARVSKARVCLIEALGIVRANRLRLAAPLEQRIGGLEVLEAKFSKLADGDAS